MPIINPQDIPAFATLEKENIFVMESERAMTQDIRPIEIAILNLMPTKIETETQLIRLLSNSPLQIKVTLIGTESYVGTHTSLGHLQKFYKTFWKYLRYTMHVLNQLLSIPQKTNIVPWSSIPYVEGEQIWHRFSLPLPPHTTLLPIPVNQNYWDYILNPCGFYYILYNKIIFLSLASPFSS